MSFNPVSPAPTGMAMGSVPVGRFTGELNSDLLQGLAGGVFFSPALLESVGGNYVDIAEIDVSARSADVYARPPETSARLWRFGPGSSSRTNDSLHRTQPIEYMVTATLVQTIPPGPTTIIKIP